MFSNSQTLDCAYPVIKETIPKSSLGYSSNNLYPGFPPLMSDARSVTAAWQHESVLNNDLLKSSGVTTNWEYRKYLTNNAQSIMEKNFRDASNDTGYVKRFANPITEQDTALFGTPTLYTSIFDNKNINSSQDNDLKNLYLTREQLESRRVSPSITQATIIGSK
jgi:hypothetical protein